MVGGLVVGLQQPRRGLAGHLSNTVGSRGSSAYRLGYRNCYCCLLRRPVVPGVLGELPLRESVEAARRRI